MIFLTVEEVIEIHSQVIRFSGGSDGIRDSGLLTSAVEMAKATMFGEFLHPSIFAKGAAYLFHIICNHPFVGGNKPTVVASAFVFFDMNKMELKFDEYDLENLVVKVAEGK